MKSRKLLKRFLVLSLSLMLLLTLAEGSIAKAENTDLTPITLTIGVPAGNVGAKWMSGGIFTNENAVLQFIKDKFAIELEFVTYDSDKFNMLMAGGALPDIVLHTWGASEVQKSAKAGYFMDLTELLNEYGPHILKNQGHVLKYINSAYDGIYYLTCDIYTGSNYSILSKNGGDGLKIRYDIYKAIGSPEVKTEDDYLNMLKAMQDYQRAATGDDTIYAIGFSGPDDTGWAYVVSKGFEYYQNTYIDISENDVVLQYQGYRNEEGKQNPLYDEYVFYNKAYRMGILDPDSLIMTWDQFSQKVQSGKLLSTYRSIYPDLSQLGPDAILTYIPCEAFPGMGSITSSIKPTGNKYGAERGISTNCKHPERAMQLLDWFDSPEGARMICNGIQGVDWDYDENGVPGYIGEMAIMYEKGADTTEVCDARTLRNVSAWQMISSPEIDCGDGYPVWLHDTQEYKALTITDAQRNFAHDFYPDCVFPGQVYQRWVDEGIMEAGSSKFAFYCRVPTYDVNLDEYQNSYIASAGSWDTRRVHFADMITAANEEELRAAFDAWAADMQIETTYWWEDEVQTWLDDATKDFVK